MKKTGFKAFIFSFSITLSAIMIADCFFAPKNQLDEQPIISNKSIALFITQNNNVQAASHPVRKIALTTLPETKPKEPEQISLTKQDIIPPKPEDMVIMADADSDDAFDYDYIPLNIEINTKEKTIEIVEESSKPTLIAETETTKQEEIIIPEIIVKENPVSKELPQTQEIKVAQADKAQNSDEQYISEEIMDNTTPELLIPLERGDNSVIAQKNLRIVHSGEDNQVASTSNKAPTKDIYTTPKSTQKNTPQEITSDDAWVSMEEISSEKKNSTDNPWVAAVGTKHPKNNLILEAESNKDSNEINKILNPNLTTSKEDETKLAAEMIDNLIIPIPEDIKNKKNLTPQLTSSEENKYIEQELDEELGVDREDDDQIVISDAQGNNLHKENKGGFFNSITSIFKSDTNEIEETDNNNENVIDTISKKIGLKRKGMNILPTEIRLSFQPNRAEISGTTLQWIQAFGKKAAEEETVALEIRLDANSSPSLQHKRLNLLSNILSSRGVGGHKLRVVYTAREPNSFVIRTIRIDPKDKEKKPQYRNQNVNAHYLQW